VHAVAQLRIPGEPRIVTALEIATPATPGKQQSVALKLFALLLVPFVMTRPFRVKQQRASVSVLMN
jgi:hypothetical protein